MSQELPSGEPPGSDFFASTEPDVSNASKLVKIGVLMEVLEADTGRASFLIQEPLGDALHDAIVVCQEHQDRNIRRSIGVVQTVTASRINGHVRYLGIVMTQSEQQERVQGAIASEVAALVERFKLTADIQIAPLTTDGKALVTNNHRNLEQA